jgi:DNA polymerase III alpha subunit
MSTNCSEEILAQGVLLHGPKILDKCLADPADITNYLERIADEYLDYPVPLSNIDIKKWFIPAEYCPDLVAMLYDLCKTDEQRQRVDQELELFVKHNMYDLLHVMKYIVDTLRENNIVWGVGRGSSVASYVLYLIGVHKIDSVKYKLPIEEFFKGDQNG